MELLLQIQLGSPSKVDIKNPKYLTNSGISVQSSTNLTDIILINVNIGDVSTPAQVNGFKVFNNLYV